MKKFFFIWLASTLLALQPSYPMDSFKVKKVFAVTGHKKLEEVTFKSDRFQGSKDVIDVERGYSMSTSKTGNYLEHLNALKSDICGWVYSNLPGSKKNLYYRPEDESYELYTRLTWTDNDNNELCIKQYLMDRNKLWIFSLFLPGLPGYNHKKYCSKNKLDFDVLFKELIGKEVPVSAKQVHDLLSKELQKQKALFKFEQFDNNYFIDIDRHYKVLNGRDNVAEYVWYISLNKPDVLEFLYKKFMRFEGMSLTFLSHQESDDFDAISRDDVVIAFSCQYKKERLDLCLHRSEIDNIFMSEDALFVKYKGQNFQGWKFIGEEEQISNTLQSIYDPGKNEDVITPLELYVAITSALIRQKDLERKKI